MKKDEKKGHAGERIKQKLKERAAERLRDLEPREGKIGRRKGMALPDVPIEMG